jgi:hypothetical protein
MEAIERLQQLIRAFQMANYRLCEAMATRSINPANAWAQKEVEVKAGALVYWKRQIAKQVTLL